MASIKFIIRSKLDKAVPVYVVVSIKRGQVYFCRTGFVIHPKNWSEFKGLPKQNDETNKQIAKQLKVLESFLTDRINEAQSEGESLSKEFFDNQIDICFNRSRDEDDQDLFISHVNYIINNASSRKIKGKSRVGLSENTIKNYQTFKKIVEEFQRYSKKPIRFRDIDLVFTERFKGWLLNKKNYSVNHAGKSIAFLKSISIDAEKIGIKVNPKVHIIEAFTESNEDRNIVTLTVEELEKIKQVKLERGALVNARKWLLIGCEIGQRGGDLLNLNEAMIRDAGDCRIFDIKQQKTGKIISVPITKEINRILQDGFPYKVSQAKFNEYIKDIAKAAELNDLIDGKKYNKETKRKEFGKYPKHMLITSHTCRRSFATNYYKKVPTTILMGITGHSKESTFLAYINKPKDMDENARMFLKYMD
ncbi:site-specific integrase [Echinicola marina]|uniref:tyrosine-type recombinase/integrase n=1 Tax=Echinicola marina TaxID=2859768 RepID=UPI001CF63C68|nr:tyrosine-type recombinase/integrase [Echinicola marina]UCS93778.1 site-specific integrase [Echinicola marina]